MHKPCRIAMLMLMCSLLSACVLPKARPLTMQEQDAWMAREQCSQEASNVYPDWPCSDNPLWDDYFCECMQSLGISGAAISRMWY